MTAKLVTDWIQNQLFDQVPLNISVIDRNFFIVDANRRFAEIYGAWAALRCHQVYKDQAKRCTRCGVASTFKDGQIRVAEEEGVSQDGRKFFYLVHMFPVFDWDGEVQYVVNMSTDISETKDLQQKKLEAERLAAVGQTVAGLAHGIKNIIMGLEGGMYVVNSGLRRNDEKKLLQGWKMLENDIKRISSFAKEFLDFAKGRQPRVSVVDPNSVAQRVVDLFHDTAELAGIEIKIKLQKGIVPANLDEEGIHSCLTNLVSNALDACEMSSEGGRQVLVTTQEEDGVLTFEVADDGCGMDYDIKKKVFTNFFSTKGAGKGTGLGLLTTRKIVQEHGGKVTFESTEGLGSVFRLEFPRIRLPGLPVDSVDE